MYVVQQDKRLLPPALIDWICRRCTAQCSLFLQPRWVGCTAVWGHGLDVLCGQALRVQAAVRRTWHSQQCVAVWRSGGSSGVIRIQWRMFKQGGL